MTASKNTDSNAKRTLGHMERHCIGSSCAGSGVVGALVLMYCLSDASRFSSADSGGPAGFFLVAIESSFFVWAAPIPGVGRQRCRPAHVLALQVAHLRTRSAARAGISLSTRKVLEELADIEETVLLYHDGAKGHPRAQRLLTDHSKTAGNPPSSSPSRPTHQRANLPKGPAWAIHPENAPTSTTIPNQATFRKLELGGGNRFRGLLACGPGGVAAVEFDDIVAFPA